MRIHAFDGGEPEQVPMYTFSIVVTTSQLVTKSRPYYTTQSSLNSCTKLE